MIVWISHAKVGHCQAPKKTKTPSSDTMGGFLLLELWLFIITRQKGSVGQMETTAGMW